VTDVALEDPGSWLVSAQGRSQAALQIHRGLVRIGVEVTVVGPVPELLRGRPLLRNYAALKERFYRRVRGQAYARQAEPRVVDVWSDRIAERLATVDHDVVLVLGNALPIGPRGFGTDRPIAYCHDAPIVALLDFYPHAMFANPCRETRANLLAFEQAALRRCELVMYACDWSAKKAIAGYGLDPAKVEVVPWGANLDAVPEAQDIARMVASRPVAPCRLLFFGVEWLRKGGDIATEVARELNQRGVETELTVLGCAPLIEGPLPAFIEPLGFVDKFLPSGRATIDATLARSHFLILPTRAEVFGHVLSEANAFGVPSLAPDIGGLSTVIVDGVNGALMGPGARPHAYADFIARTMADPVAYRALAQSSRRRFEERLSWDVAVRDIKRLLERTVAGSRGGRARRA